MHTTASTIQESHALHEKPAPGLLPDGPRYRAALEDAYATYRSQGAGPGHQKVLAAAGLTGGPEPAEPMVETST